MRRIGLILSLLVASAVGGWAAAGAWWPARATGDPLVGRVERVLDGDTIRVRLPAGGRTVRVIGIDTPEIPHPGKPEGCFGRDAARYVQGLLHDRVVRLTPGVERKDRYGRTLATVAAVDGDAAGQDLSSLLAAGGYARPLAIRPNTANAPAIAQLVNDARRAHRGLWGACTYAAAFPGKRPLGAAG